MKVLCIKPASSVLGCPSSSTLFTQPSIRSPTNPAQQSVLEGTIERRFHKECKAQQTKCLKSSR